METPPHGAAFFFSRKLRTGSPPLRRLSERLAHRGAVAAGAATHATKSILENEGVVKHLDVGHARKALPSGVRYSIELRRVP